MKFWDSSALTALFVTEPHTESVKTVADEDGSLAAWWGSQVECCSSFARRRRDGIIGSVIEDQLRTLVLLLAEQWTEIQPVEDLRITAQRLLLAHPLRAADALQLAAALTWAGRQPNGHQFVCLDERLRVAAMKEGFEVLPGSGT